jgi:hypothetical protein
VPNGRFLLFSSACRSKKKKEESNYDEEKIKKMVLYSKELLGEVWGKSERVNQRVINKRTTIFLKDKIGRKA